MTTTDNLVTDKLTSLKQSQQRRDRFIRILTILTLVGVWVLITEMK
jgi:hypothetical protein